MLYKTMCPVQKLKRKKKRINNQKQVIDACINRRDMGPFVDEPIRRRAEQ